MALTAKENVHKPPIAPQVQLDTPTPTPTQTTTPTATPTLTPTSTGTSTSTPTPTATSTSTATSTATPTSTPTSTSTSTPTPTSTTTPTPTQTATVTQTATPTATSTPVGLPSLPSLAVITLNRLAFGPRPGDIDAFNALGATDIARFTAWVDQQLSPGPDDQDSTYWMKRGQHNLYTLGKSVTQLWADHYKNANDANPRWRPTKDVVIDTILRAMHSKWQLREVLADFWHNHFNIYAYEGYQEALWAHWNRDVIRKNIFGNFRTFIEDVSASPAMLYYLDNFINTRAGPNENWARELLELHTLGAENYYGIVQPDQVPKLPGDTRSAGYCDEDVYSAAALCFTGWGVNDHYQTGTGAFEYTEADHDNLSRKNFLGISLAPNNNEAQDDGRNVLDILAGRPAARVRTDGLPQFQRPAMGAHTGVAKYICRKLARRLIMDNPPQALVDAAVQVFLTEYQAADQLKKVVRAILLWSPTPGGLPLFATTWAEKIKRPFEVAMAMCRAVQAELKFQVLRSTNNGTPVPAYWDEEDEFFYYYEPMGQPIFEWHPPNGYPDRKEAWKSTTSMLVRWKFAYWLANAGSDANNDHVDVDYVGQNSGTTATAIADYWIARILGRPLRDVDRSEIIRFMQGTYGPTSPLPTNDIKNRLKYMVALILSAPDFNFR